MQKRIVHASDSLEGAKQLQIEYPSDLIALPAHVCWHEVADAKKLNFNYSRLCATNIYDLPYRSLDVIWNTPIRCMLSTDKIYEFDENKKEIISFDAEVN